MLYESTRSNRDAFTWPQVLRQDRAKDSGFYVPFRFPNFSEEELNALEARSFGENVSYVLGLFFPVKLDSREVEFTIGRNPLKLSSLTQRITVAELWRNFENNFDYIKHILFRKLTGDESARPVTEWCNIAIEIAGLFAIYGEMLRQQILAPGQLFDISLSTQVFSYCMTAIYAKQMGLPVATVILCCEEGNPLWDLVNMGEFSARGVAKMSAEAQGNLLTGTERLLHRTLGSLQVQKYLSCMNTLETYIVDKSSVDMWKKWLFASVISGKRLGSVIHVVYRNNRYIVDPITAAAVSGLHDYRANTGEHRPALLLSTATPATYTAEIQDALQIPADKILAALGKA